MIAGRFFLVKRRWSELYTMCYGRMLGKQLEGWIVVVPFVFVDGFFFNGCSNLLGCRGLTVLRGGSVSVKKCPCIYRRGIDMCSGCLRGVG